ncbi:MAG: hypothetical protein RL326_326 [Pseudomonadota bacterium]|jgi:hypothetical protein
MTDVCADVSGRTVPHTKRSLVIATCASVVMRDVMDVYGIRLIPLLVSSLLLRIKKLSLCVLQRTRGVSMAIQFPEQRPRSPTTPRSEEDMILESSLESFPASDPPAWVHGKDIPPKPPQSAEQHHSDARKVGWLKRLAVRFKKCPCALNNDSPNDRPCCQSPN